MKVLVTGGAGYIGSILTKKLIKHGYETIVFDNLIYTDFGVRDLKDNHLFNLVNSDIREKETFRKAVKGVDIVIHLAAIANDPSGELDPKLTQQVNFEVYPMLLEECIKAGVKRFLNASTFGVYGIKDGINITEDESLNPLKEYSVCKAKSEVLVKEANSSDFVGVSLRCATVCGWSPRLRLDLIVNTLAANAIAKKEIVVYGGDQKRPQIHIDDLTNYFIELMNIPAEKIFRKIFNAGGQNVTIMEIAQTIKEIMGENLKLKSAPSRFDERTYHVSSEKIFNELGLSPKKTISDAIKEIHYAYSIGFWEDPENIFFHNVKWMKSLGFDQNLTGTL